MVEPSHARVQDLLGAVECECGALGRFTDDRDLVWVTIEDLSGLSLPVLCIIKIAQ